MSGLERSDVVILNKEHKSQWVKYNKRKEVQTCQNAVIERLSGGGAPLKASYSKGLRRISKRVAFTLAEVLITLGVIGVVAALTMPTLLKNIAERSNSEAQANLAQKITKSMDLMMQQE